MILAIGQVTIEQRRAFAIALCIVAYVGTRGKVHVQSGAAIAPVASHVNGSTRGTDRTTHVFDHMCWAVQQVPGLQTRTPPPKKKAKSRSWQIWLSLRLCGVHVRGFRGRTGFHLRYLRMSAESLVGRDSSMAKDKNQVPRSRSPR